MAGSTARRRREEAKTEPKAPGEEAKPPHVPELLPAFPGLPLRIWMALLVLLVSAAAVILVSTWKPAEHPGKQTDFEVWASARRNLPDALQMKLALTGFGLCGIPRRGNRCARFVLDGVVPAAEVKELAELLQWLVSEAWGAGSGPPSVVDLHAETISYKDQRGVAVMTLKEKSELQQDNFVNLTMFMEFKSLKFTQKQVEAYSRVRQALRKQLSRLFGVPLEGLQHDMTFFSHINGSKTAQTTHDEYWHSHIDTEQYGTFAYTVLLYLNSADHDFDGGEFIFEESRGNGVVVPAAAVEPRAGRVVAFSSDAENPHKVLKVSRGVRMALTAAFTCSQEQAASIQSFPNPSMVEWSGTAAE
ncbi:OGFOD3 [Symbiodinium natans]|uniref:OGFOD3 protein n=1 Tax=Symbiodinium natans TaxID=878477 RepID=A0A812NV23_9DINO|nr:OGFOD3 [Symbiodinium natans]